MKRLAILSLSLLWVPACLAAEPKDQAWADRYIDQSARWQVPEQLPPRPGKLREELNRQVEAFLQLAGDDVLAPVVIQRGIGGYLECFGNPAATAGVLADVAPLLDKPLRAKALKAAGRLIEKYPPWKVTWQNRGADGAWQKRPSDLRPLQRDLDVPLGNLYFLWQVAAATDDYKLVEKNWDAISALAETYNKRPRQVEMNIRSRWLQDRDKDGMQSRLTGRLCIGLIEPGTLKMTTRIGPDRKTTMTLTDDGKGRLVGEDGSSGTIDYRTGQYEVNLRTATRDKGFNITCQAAPPLLYADVAGLIGYARLADKLDKPQARQARSTARSALALARQYGYNTMYQMAVRTFIHQNNHDGAYCPMTMIRSGRGRLALSVLWSHEIGRLLGDMQKQQVAEHLRTYEIQANQRAWFQNHGLPGPDTVNGRPVVLPGGDGIGGENCCVGPAVGWAFYMLRAYVTHAPEDKLIMWIDVPWARVGDTMHIQRLAACIRSHGRRTYDHWNKADDDAN